jgi:hypothetical protein
MSNVGVTCGVAWRGPGLPRASARPARAPKADIGIVPRKEEARAVTGQTVRFNRMLYDPSRFELFQLLVHSFKGCVY